MASEYREPTQLQSGAETPAGSSGRAPDGSQGAISPAEAENFQLAHTHLKKGQICHILDILDKRRAATALALALASDFSRLDQYEIRYDTIRWRLTCAQKLTRWPA